MHWSTYKPIHQLCCFICNRQSVSQPTLHGHGCARSSIVSGTISSTPPASAHPSLFRRSVQERKANSKYCVLRSDTHNYVLRQHSLLPLRVLPPDWGLLGVHTIHIRCPPPIAGLDPECWSMVVFLHRDVRLVPGVLPRGILASSRGLCRRFVCAASKPAFVRHHNVTGPLRNLQAISKYLRYRLIPLAFAVLPTCFSL